MKIVPTRRTDYAIRALVYLARDEGEMVTASTLAEEMTIPKGFLHQILPILQRSGLVASRPGRTGGYVLARPADEVTLLDIVEATEGPLEAAECALKGGPCHWEEVCALHWVWGASKDAFAAELKKATLARIVADDRALAEGTAVIPLNSHRGSSRTP
ncbi:MAG TPA: Rrf2 family transcriptional regulator [Actinobacteria bacterium]|nr:HTH-type transcriptional regulator CymR [bacterium BMS3Bbin02]HDL41642.1 Rrf2 family transcriptional regulator [Actinomycetota bacterium]